MDLVVGDRVRVLNKISTMFIMPDSSKIYYTLQVNEICQVIYVSVVDQTISIVINDGNGVGGTVPFVDRIKLEKID